MQLAGSQCSDRGLNSHRRLTTRPPGKSQGDADPEVLRQPGKENAWFLPTHNPTATPRMKPRPAGWGRGPSGPPRGPNQSPFIQIISRPLLSTYCVPPAWKSKASGGGVGARGAAESGAPLPQLPKPEEGVSARTPLCLHLQEHLFLFWMGVG